MEIGRQRVVRAARQLHRARAIGHQQRRQHRLQHQHGAARARDREAVVPGLERHRRKLQLRHARSDGRQLRIADGLRGLHTGQVLAHQPRLGAPGPDAVHRQRPLRDDRQRQRRAQHLATALALRAVDLDQALFYGLACDLHWNRFPLSVFFF